MSKPRAPRGSIHRGSKGLEFVTKVTIAGTGSGYLRPAALQFRELSFDRPDRRDE